MKMLLACVAFAGLASAESLPRNGFDLHYRTMGKGPVVVLLSGGPGFEVDYMLPVAEKLADSFTCVLLEQRGTGRSRAAKFDAAVDDATERGGGSGGAAGPFEAGVADARRALVGRGCWRWRTRRRIPRAGRTTGADQFRAEWIPQFQLYFGPNIEMRLWPADRDARTAAKTPVENIRAIAPGAYFFDREKALAFAKATPDECAAWRGVGGDVAGPGEELQRPGGE